jgi:hypothetical protein
MLQMNAHYALALTSYYLVNGSLFLQYY